MSDTVVSGQRSIKIGRLAIEERLLLRLVTWGILFALAAAVMLLRLQRLDELPPGLFVDEDRDGLAALRVLQGEHAIFFPDVGHGREPWAIYVLALSTLLFGRTLFAMHLPTALGGAGMVFAVFWMGRLLFGGDEKGEKGTPWRGLLIGSVAAGLMAVSIGQTILGRTAYNKTTFMPLLLTLCLGLLWWGWKERRWRWVVLAGICAGVLPYTYMAARFVPFLFLAYALTFFFPLRDVTWKRVRREIPWAAAFTGAAALVAAPLLIHFALHPEHFLLRSQRLLVFAPEISQGAPFRTLLFNVLEYIAVLGFAGDPSWRNNYAGQPLLNHWETIFFWIGVGMAVFCWRRSTYRLLLLWLLIMLLPAFLARDDLAPSTMRMLGAAPSIYLLLGVGVWEVSRLLKERLFGGYGTKAAIVVGSVAGAAVLVQGIATHSTYFQKWSSATEVQSAYFPPIIRVSQVLSERPFQTNLVYLLPLFKETVYFNQYLYPLAAPARHVHPGRPGWAQRVEAALAAEEGVSTVGVVEWKGDAARLGDDDGRFVFLLSKYGHYQGSEEYEDFRLHSFTDISLARPLTVYENLEPLPVAYDGGISLKGLAVGQGPEQMPSKELLVLGRDRPMWMALKWQTVHALDVDYSISLRLYDAENRKVFQEDDVLRDLNFSSTSSWSAEKPVETLALIHFPAELAAGEYELRLVVYEFETLVPTVQIGVWEPETALARLQLTEVQ